MIFNGFILYNRAQKQFYFVNNNNLIHYNNFKLLLQLIQYK